MSDAVGPTGLPIDDVLDQLQAAVSDNLSVVLMAPPGAGKTTRVPLHLLNAPWLAGRKIILLEPRRLAARAAAQRMAQSLGEAVGETVGYRVRFDSKTSSKTRIEVVTEGLFTRMIIEDPELAGVGAVIFDEFHERSLDADFGLALALESQTVLRDDLRILVMSATLDGARIAEHLGFNVPVVESMGRAYPVEIRYRPVGVNENLTDVAASVSLAALRSEEGSQLIFMPGEREIRQTVDKIRDGLSASQLEQVDVAPLYGALDPAQQDRAIGPPLSGRRKIVVATPIAESSLTIEGVRVIVDSGLVRQARYDPRLGATHLTTARTSRASVDQRAGRAGRTAPGLCIRLWAEPQTAALAAYSAPEVTTSDLAPLVLDALRWGEREPQNLTWLDPLPKAHLAQAFKELKTVGAIDENSKLTPLGSKLGDLPLGLRESAMIAASVQYGSDSLLKACRLAVLLGERGLGGRSADMADRLDRFNVEAGRKGRAAQADRYAKRLASQFPEVSSQNSETLSAGAILSLGFSDRLAQRTGERDGKARYRMASGSAAEIDLQESLAKEPFLAIAGFQGRAEAARVSAAATITQDEIERLHQSRIQTGEELSLTDAGSAVTGTQFRFIGKLRLDSRPIPVAQLKALAPHLLFSRLTEYGVETLPWSSATEGMLHRLDFASVHCPDFERATRGSLFENLDFLKPAFTDCRAYADIPSSKLHDAVVAMVIERIGCDSWSGLDTWAPTHFNTPVAQGIPIDYDRSVPTAACRVQMLFGLNEHPVVGKSGVPLTFELLSPAGRVMQTTQDLPSFWSGSWSDVRKDMRGRYPKHPWPEDPATAAPTARAKPRGT
jgi:ATP-dependent helicase HrpB